MMMLYSFVFVLGAALGFVAGRVWEIRSALPPPPPKLILPRGP
jgi:hypothetical protein